MDEESLLLKLTYWSGLNVPHVDNNKGNCEEIYELERTTSYWSFSADKDSLTSRFQLTRKLFILSHIGLKFLTH
jgi:hypothetical protein